MTSPLSYDDIKSLAVELGRPASSLIVLSDSCDPFYVTPGREAAARWFADLFQHLDPGGALHLRRFHYLLISQPGGVPKHDGTRYANTNRLLEYSLRSRRRRAHPPPG